MSQNIYDEPSFFDRYSHLPRALHGLDGASEWPLLEAMMPDLKSKQVLDLGCGDGWFSRWACEQGAGGVQAIDVSKNMLERAATLGTDHSSITIQYRHDDLEGLELEAETYDVVFSGLALHYVENLEHLFQEIRRALRPGGSFIFSVEHPIFTAPTEPRFLENQSTKTQFWPLADYFTEGERDIKWLGACVKKQHRTLGTYARYLRSAGFNLESLDEWGWTKEEERKHPDWPNEGVIPRFLLIAARRPSTI